MKLAFLLSGEHPTLPESEVLATLEALDAEPEVILREQQVLCVNSREVDIKELGRRLALTHAFGEHVFSCDYSDIPSMDYNIDFSGSFSVRVWRVGKRDVNSAELERKIGEKIAAYGKKVNLSQPENLFLGIASERFHLIRVLYNVDRGSFNTRIPVRLPYFRAGAIHPRIARALVNLSRVRKGEKLCDIFCGGGGFLIEAGLIGAKVYGFDISPEAIEGARQNLSCFEIPAELRVADSLSLEGYEEEFDAVVTDPPYGISSALGGLSRKKLYTRALKKIFDILKQGRYAVFIVPRGELVEHEGFEIVERHVQRVHRSLTREILVMRKWK